MKFSFIVAVLLALGAAGGCKRPAQQGAPPGEQSAPHELPAMTVDELSGMLDRHEAVAVYDANGRERYERGHIPSARFVGHNPVTAAILPQDKATRLVFYCANEH